jgi:hypothetical protein
MIEEENMCVDEREGKVRCVVHLRMMFLQAYGLLQYIVLDKRINRRATYRTSLPAHNMMNPPA